MLRFMVVLVPELTLINTVLKQLITDFEAN